MGGEERAKVAERMRGAGGGGESPGGKREAGGAAGGTHALWRTHQPQWGSPEPRHSPQLRY